MSSEQALDTRIADAVAKAAISLHILWRLLEVWGVPFAQLENQPLQGGAREAREDVLAGLATIVHLQTIRRGDRITGMPEQRQKRYAKEAVDMVMEVAIGMARAS